MRRRLLLTISTFASLVGLYSLYTYFVSPHFSPAAEERVVGPDLPHQVRPRVNREAAAKYLKDCPWAADASYQVRTDEGTYVFAEEWAPVEPTGELRLKPFAMIWRKEGDPADKEPITIISDSALVQFASRVDVTNPKPGRVVGGALEGDVQIRGADGLSVKGRDFVFSEKALRIWSDNPVTFAYGKNSGRGHGLELDLLPETGQLSADKPGISGLRTVRLRRNVSMDLRSDSKDKKSREENVHIASTGTFEFAVAAHVATFQNEVRVIHPTGPNQSDKLDCDLLTLVFAEAPPANAIPTANAPAPLPAGPVPAAAAPSAARPAGPMGLGRNLTFRRLRGEGKVVTLVSQRSELQAEMKELTYDAQSRVITMQDGKQVRVIQKNNEVYCPEITIEHAEDGKVVKAICRGTGQLKSFSADKLTPSRRGPLAFSAEWLRQLQKHADTTPGLDVIEFEGQARLHQPGQMELEGDIVRVWVTQDTGKPPFAAQPEQKRLDSVANPAVESKGPPVDIKRLLALQKVTFASPQLIGQTERLEVWFEPGTLPQVRPADPEPLESRAGPQKPGAGDPRGAWPERLLPGGIARSNGLLLVAERRSKINGTPHSVNKQVKPPRRPGREPAFAAVDVPPPKVAAKIDPRGLRGAPPQKPKKGSAAKPIPINVSANLIRLRAIQDRGVTEVAEIWNDGKVHVRQERRPGEPFELQGERLYVRRYSDDDQVIRIVGQPASVKDGAMQLEGPDINFDRGRNDAHVTGAGMLRLPANNALNGQQLDKPQMLDVWWKEQMQFDGETAKFFVDVKAVLGESRMKCQEMQVTFSRRIKFTESAAATNGGPRPSDDTKIVLVTCKEGVEIENYEYTGNKLTGIQRASAWEFSLSQTTGDAQGQGPGALISWRRGNGKKAGITSTSGVQANRPQEAATDAWEYTRIDFAGEMRGNVAGAFKATEEDRVTTFKDRVRIVYGPVERTTDAIDPDNLPKDGAWLRCDSLRLTQRVETQTQPAYFDMLGTGNAELEGRTFHALADIISFDGLKKLYILQSRGTRNATIWRQAKPGAGANRFDPRRMEKGRNDAQRIEYSPIGNKLILDRVRGLDGLE